MDVPVITVAVKRSKNVRTVENLVSGSPELMEGLIQLNIKRG